jgi:hypothetical protein
MQHIFKESIHINSHSSEYFIHIKATDYSVAVEAILFLLPLFRGTFKKNKI